MYKVGINASAPALLLLTSGSCLSFHFFFPFSFKLSICSYIKGTTLTHKESGNQEAVRFNPTTLATSPILSVKLAFQNSNTY
jgi:hypothetical protein